MLFELCRKGHELDSMGKCDRDFFCRSERIYPQAVRNFQAFDWLKIIDLHVEWPTRAPSRDRVP